MSSSIKNSGIWAPIQHIWVKSAGIWNDVQKAFVKDAGVWKLFFSRSSIPALSNQAIVGGPSVTVSFNNDGTLTKYESGGGTTITVTGQWLTSSPATVSSAVCAAYDVMFTYTSGPNPNSGTPQNGGATKSGSGYGVWFNLATTRSISLGAYPGSISGDGNGILRYTADIRPAGGGAILATGAFILNAST